MVNRMRLIDAETLMKAMYHRAFETDGDTMWQSGCWVRYRAIEQVVKEQPSVEAEPVRHGKWLTDNDAFKRMYLVCSLCKRATQTPWYVGGFLYDYCPNCGAKMDEAT